MASQSESAIPSSVNPDLQKERDAASFDVDKLTNLLDGGQNKTNRRRQIVQWMTEEPVFNYEDKIFLSEEERYDRSILISKKHLEFKKKHKLLPEEEGIISSMVFGGINVHYIMFLPMLERLATDEQQQRWVQKSRDLKIIGTYAQTELGHGTFLRGLETTATYDTQSQEFILNTPFPSGMKWWPGSMGKTANHIIIMAQLSIDNKSYGMQAFMLQLRDMDTHQPLPGVEVGHIGPIYGKTVLDNGFLNLQNVKIPRTNMLMRYAKVSADGQFSRVGDARVNYGGMVLVRMNMARAAYATLSKSVTIATRYAAVRRQSELKPGGPEPQIMDYQTQQYKLFPYVAATYALFFSAKYIRDTYYHIYETQLKKGDFSRMAELHSQSACLKAMTSEISAEGSEVVRRACGGHGFLMSSGLPEIITDTLPLATAEGENTVLYLQTARYLMKECATVTTGSKVSESSSYLNQEPGRCHINDVNDCLNMTNLIHAFQHRAYRIIKDVSVKLQRQLESGREQYKVWNQNSVQLVRAAKAHVDGILVSNFASYLEGLNVEASIRLVLTRLCCLYAVHRLVISSGEFLETGAITTDQLNYIQEAELNLLASIRPDAVALVDAFDWHDYALQSAIGAYDGNAYHRLYEIAKKAPLNKTQVAPAFEKYIKPMQQSKL